MLDVYARRVIDPFLNRQGAFFARLGVSADQMTLFGLALGLGTAGLIAANLSFWAMIPLLLSRLADGLDGAIARATKKTDFGGYLDITCDFLFYGAVPMAFIWQDPTSNAVAGAFFLTSFYFNGASFLGFAILAEKHKMRSTARGVKSLYFTGGILEGTETIGFFLLLCLVPAYFSPLAWVFGALCFMTAISRVVLAWKEFGAADQDKNTGQSKSTE